MDMPIPGVSINRSGHTFGLNFLNLHAQLKFRLLKFTQLNRICVNLHT